MVTSWKVFIFQELSFIALHLVPLKNFALSKNHILRNLFDRYLPQYTFHLTFFFIKRNNSPPCFQAYFFLFILSISIYIYFFSFIFYLFSFKVHSTNNIYVYILMFIIWMNKKRKKEKKTTIERPANIMFSGSFCWYAVFFIDYNLK
jgi:hypothetical protein